MPFVDQTVTRFSCFMPSQVSYLRYPRINKFLCLNTQCFHVEFKNLLGHSSGSRKASENVSKRTEGAKGSRLDFLIEQAS